MDLTKEQIQMVLGTLGAFGPQGRATVPNDNLPHEIYRMPVTTRKGYLFPAIFFLAQDPVTGQVGEQQWFAFVHGDPVAPAVLAAAAIAPAVTDIAVPPTFNIALVGTDLVYTATVPLGGVPTDVAVVNVGVQIGP